MVDSSLYRKVVHDWMTEPDGLSYCPARFIILLAVFVYILFSAYILINLTKLDSQFLLTFAGGFSTLFASGGAMLMMKKDTPIQEKNNGAY